MPAELRHINSFCRASGRFGSCPAHGSSFGPCANCRSALSGAAAANFSIDFDGVVGVAGVEQALRRRPGPGRLRELPCGKLLDQFFGRTNRPALSSSRTCCSTAFAFGRPSSWAFSKCSSADLSSPLSRSSFGADQMQLKPIGPLLHRPFGQLPDVDRAIPCRVWPRR